MFEKPIIIYFNFYFHGHFMEEEHFPECNILFILSIKHSRVMREIYLNCTAVNSISICNFVHPNSTSCETWPLPV